MAAASGNPVGNFCQEATCPICLDYFRDPVTIVECGHNYCRACLVQCWGPSKQKASCPQCRARAQPQQLIPNRALANFVELTKKLSLRGEERLCQKHQEPLKLFCKEDQSPICVVCDRAKEHKDHQVVPAEEAAQELKEKLHGNLWELKKREEYILANTEKIKKEGQNLLMHTRAERENMVAEFRELHQFLEEQEKHLLAQLQEVEKEIIREREEQLARVAKELSRFQNLIAEIEKMSQKPMSEFLQDIENTRQRCQEELNLPDKRQYRISPTVKWRTWEFCDISSFMKCVMKQFKDKLISGIQLQKANVTLDPDTAHPRIILSEDRKSMKLNSKSKGLPPNPKRFDHYLFVLGHEEFTAGRYFWDVRVESDYWAVGVARKSVRRKGQFKCGPEEGFWAAGNYWGEHTVPDFTSMSGWASIVRVSLNCSGRRVAFYDAETADLLSVISGVPFSEESVHPFFYLGPKKRGFIATILGFFDLLHSPPTTVDGLPALELA
ncbi:E3 ubiquitin-protein ligase TRIM7-like [Anolis sagrei]|uniref:E3 ubiquitin-protein ligase TRIM7-like n=1 Tax=Anolis sagrei TaxID=38937 RepID=UPI00352236BE